MSNDQDAIKYVNHNKVRIKAGIKREEITKIWQTSPFIQISVF
jgi:hypothetical protein